jgi:hypothetical protein
MSPAGSGPKSYPPLGLGPRVIVGLTTAVFVAACLIGVLAATGGVALARPAPVVRPFPRRPWTIQPQALPFSAYAKG